MPMQQPVVVVNPQSSSQTLAKSANGLATTKQDFAKAIAHLCALKRTTEFTKQQLEVWFGGLRAFPAWIVNRAVLTLATSQDRFPEFGDVYQLCRKEAIHAGLMTEPYIPTGTEERKISSAEITTIGTALGLAVKPSANR